MHLSMDDREFEKPQDCYSFQAIRDIWKKHKSHSSNRIHVNNNVHKINHLSSRNHKIKPSFDAQDDDFCKGARNKKQDAYKNMNGMKKAGHNGLDKELRKHENQDLNSCFKAIIFLTASKKKQIPSKVSASDLPDDAIYTQTVEKTPSRARSLDSTPSIGRSRSINNSRSSEAWASNTPKNSRVPSINRTNSIGSGTNSFNNRMNGSFVNRSTSIGRSRSDEVTCSRRISASKSGPLIMFSNSSGVLKPPTIEQQLECTLEELCHGCVKHIKVTREIYVFTGQVIQEEQVFTVNVKPGWRTGTKITFKGTTSEEKPGQFPADIVFIITEKHHPLFLRNEDDLELEIEIPLVDALTGCTLTIPLLGKDKMSMTIDDIVYPGYEKLILGQGMPNQKNPHHRGDLKVKFLVEFPTTLMDEQRSQVFRILSD